MTELTVTPDDQLITTLPQLREWIAARPQHQERPDGGCACGWNPQVGRSWNDHATWDDINDLHRVLVAPTGNAGSVAESEESLYACIDARDERCNGSCWNQDAD